MQTKHSSPILYLLGKKGLAVLSAFVEAGSSQHILAVVVATDNAMAKDYAKEVVELANQNNITVFLRNDSSIEKLVSDVAFAVGWRWLIPPSKHQLLVVFHDSLLPRFRGFAPLVSQLLKGENRIGVTALHAAEEYDKGNILGQESVRIEYPIKIEQAIDKVLPLYQELALKVYNDIRSEKDVTGVKQDETKATYSIWRDDHDLKVNWNESSAQLKRFVDATGFPYQGAYTLMDDKRILITDVEEVEDLNVEFRHVGKTIRFQNQCPVVICGSGLLLIKSAKWVHSGEEITKWPRFRVRFS